MEERDKEVIMNQIKSLNEDQKKEILSVIPITTVLEYVKEYVIAADSIRTQMENVLSGRAIH